MSSNQLNLPFFLLLKQSGCSSHPCVNGATCVPCYESNEYHCACVAGYSGQSCEIGIWLLNVCESFYTIDEPIFTRNVDLKLPFFLPPVTQSLSPID